jgi:hypothetical protein
MECHGQLNESELLLAVLLPVCMVALIIVAVAIYCIVMSPSLCPGRRDHALSVEAAVAEALAKDRRARDRKKAHNSQHAHAHDAKKHNVNQQRRISARRAQRHSRSDDVAPAADADVLSNTAHHDFIAKSVSPRKRPDADYDGAPVASHSTSGGGRTAEDASSHAAAGQGAAPERPNKTKTTKKGGAVAYDVVHDDDPHDGESSSSANKAD